MHPIRLAAVIVALAFSLALGLNVAVSAETAGPPSARVRKACMADVRRLCSGVMPWNIKKCMRRHAEQLSDGCKGAAQAAGMAGQSPAPLSPAPASGSLAAASGP